ncbi:MAG: hypothetical protein ACYTFX_08645 [Planctomycetota bacterium]|jgi:hypothetical protein
MKKHTRQIISGVGLFLVAIIIIPTIFCISIAIYIKCSTDLLATVGCPSRQTVKIETAGRYYIWDTTMVTSNTYFFVGAMMPRPNCLPKGIMASLKAKESNRTVEFVSTQSTTEQDDSYIDSTVYFEVSEPGTYIFSLSGTEPTTQFGIPSYSLGKSISNPAVVYNSLIACLVLRSSPA